MPGATRLDDIGSEHECHFPPTPAIAASSDVEINGKGALRVGDPYLPHVCPAGHAPIHPRSLAKGSPTVEINGRAAGRIGDAIDCGGQAQSGSSDVFFDGE